MNGWKRAWVYWCISLLVYWLLSLGVTSGAGVLYGPDGQQNLCLAKLRGDGLVLVVGEPHRMAGNTRWADLGGGGTRGEKPDGISGGEG